MRSYRKLISRLSAALDVPEQKMCAAQWRLIAPAGVPAACLNKKRRAFMNQNPEKFKSGKSNPNKDGVRRPDDEDRVECRKIWDAFLEASKAGKCAVHGRNLLITDLVKKYKDKLSRCRTIQEDEILEAQFRDMLGRIDQEITEESVDPNSAAANIVPLVDVSGSMNGLPMDAAIGLGILLSLLIKHPAFHRRVLSFTSTPSWHNLGSSNSLAELIQNVMSTPWGMTTNIEIALKLVIVACREAGIEDGNLPKLAIFSDMQFDAARRPDRMGLRYGPSAPEPWDTQYMRLEKICRENGYSKVPEVIFWNLRGDTDNVPVKSDTKGTVMMSGFSPNLLKLFLTGKLDSVAGERPDPNEAVQVVMRSERYNRVRAIVAATGGA